MSVDCSTAEEQENEEIYDKTKTTFAREFVQPSRREKEEMRLELKREVEKCETMNQASELCGTTKAAVDDS